MEKLWNEEHVVIMDKCEDWEKAIRLLGDRLIRTRTVGRVYIDRVLEREREYPTGLSLEGGINAAIPHADANGVFRPGLALGVIRQGVGFREMVSKDPVRVQLVFLLAAVSGEGQLGLLQRVMELLQNRSIRERILSAEREDQIVGILGKRDQPSRGEESWRKNG
ncbi:MAG: PTS sugar transporter subunit IIA [Planifilum fimeticola]